jgi:hypothetical protein
MAEPATAPDHGTSPRRWLWWTIALLVVALLVAVGVALWLRQGTSIPPLAPTVVAGPPRFGDMPDLSAAATLPPDGTSSPTKSAARPVTGVFIEPGDGRAPILDEIQGARHSIDLEVVAARRWWSLASPAPASRSAGEIRSSASLRWKRRQVSPAPRPGLLTQLGRYVANQPSVLKNTGQLIGCKRG